MIELLQPQDKTFTNEALLLMDEQRKWFLEMEAAPNENAVEIVEMTAKDLECYMNFTDKAPARFERIDTNMKILLWVKWYQTALHATEKSLAKGESI